MRGPRRQGAGRWLVSLLIVALLPTPLPRVEYHNVRHHDAPGEVCDYHDHLLHWHPDATGATDLPVLHWHWGWIAPGFGDNDHAGPDLRLHAAHPTTDAGPVDPQAQLIARPTSTPLDRLVDLGHDETWSSPSWCLDPASLSARPRPDLLHPVAVRAARPAPLPLHARLGRWSC